jgi:hypothetical protein
MLRSISPRPPFDVETELARLIQVAAATQNHCGGTFGLPPSSDVKSIVSGRAIGQNARPSR